MPTVSVITAAEKSRRPFVIEAGESVAAQVLPHGWALQWLVQEDGAEPDLQDVASLFPFASYQANQRRLGAGPTRNLALVRAEGEFVHILDCDDLLLPNALAASIQAFTDNPDIHWVAARADDLLADGGRVPFELSVESGRLPAGLVSEYLRRRRPRNVHPAGLTIRTTTARALGGWGGLPAGEDTHLLAALAELTAGYLLPTVTWLYRKHPGQTTASLPDHLPGLAGVSAQRVAALREFFGSMPDRATAAESVLSPAGMSRG